MSDVVCFGEAMVRLSPPDSKRLEQTTTLDVCVGGGELNVAVALSRLGTSSAWVSRLPENPLGRMIRNKAREQGVDTSHVVWTKGDRAGLYFLELGATPRASAVLYDRAGSAISKIEPGMVDWRKAFAEAKLFHVSGITPALSDSAAATTEEALKAAKAAGLKVSYDLNYRSKLWTAEKAKKVQEPFMEMVDVFISNEEDLKTVFGIEVQAGVDFTEIDTASYKAAAAEAMNRYKPEVVAITLREAVSVWRNAWSAMAYDGEKYYEDRKYELEVVDRVGGGDSFSAGLIWGYLGGDLERGVKFGNAFSALKHSVPGDLNWVEPGEVEKLLAGGSQRVSR